jgi:hypothetical protein
MCPPTHRQVPCHQTVPALRQDSAYATGVERLFEIGGVGVRVCPGAQQPHVGASGAQLRQGCAVFADCWCPVAPDARHPGAQYMWHKTGPKRGEPRGHAYIEYSTEEVRATWHAPRYCQSHATSRCAECAFFPRGRCSARAAAGRQAQGRPCCRPQRPHALPRRRAGCWCWCVQEATLAKVKMNGALYLERPAKPSSVVRFFPVGTCSRVPQK